MIAIVRVETPTGPMKNHPNIIERSGDGLPNPDPTFEYIGPFPNENFAHSFLRNTGWIQRQDEAHSEGEEGQRTVWELENREALVIVLVDPVYLLR